MCGMCAYHDVVCAGTSYAREWCRKTGEFTQKGQAPCEDYIEKPASDKLFAALEEKKNTQTA